MKSIDLFLFRSRDLALDIKYLYGCMCGCVYRQQSERNFVAQVEPKQINSMTILLRESGRQPKKSSRKEPSAFLHSNVTIQITSTCESVFPVKRGRTIHCLYLRPGSRASRYASVFRDAYLLQFQSCYWPFGSISRSCIQYFTSGSPFLEPAPGARWTSLSVSSRGWVEAAGA